MKDDYIAILAGKVALSSHGGYSLNEFAQHIVLAIDEEHKKIAPDNFLIALLCDAARIGYEHIELMDSNLSKTKEILESKIAYHEGFADAVTALAVNKNGEQVVGSNEKPLKEIIRNLPEAFSGFYKPPKPKGE